MSEHAERIAVLEAQHRAMKDELDQISGGIDTLQQSVTNVEKVLSNQRSFWAGVTFVASIVGYLVSQVWGFIKGG